MLSSRSGSGIFPRKLIMAACPRARVLPRGRPQIARRWFSNWLVMQPSIVQWPELWTRGAISLAISRPLTTKNSIASTPVYSSAVGVGRDPVSQNAAAVGVRRQRVINDAALGRSGCDDGQFPGEILEFLV